MPDITNPPAPAAAPAAAPVAAPATAPAPAAPAPAPVASAAPASAPAAAAPAPVAEKSALDDGSDANPWGFIPEKFQVRRDDGTLDEVASARKAAESQAQLEARVGSGDIRPKTAADYKVNAPDSMKEMFLPDAPETQDFLKTAHELGLSQRQVDGVMAKFFERVPELIAGASDADADTAIAQLKSVWPSDNDYRQNISAARRGIRELGGPLAPQLEAAFKNNALFLQFAARVGAETMEDTPPSSAGGSTGASDITALQASEAYRNARHPEHEAVSARVRAHFARQPGAKLPA